MTFLKLTESEFKVVKYTDAKISWGPTTEEMDEMLSYTKV